MAGVRSGDHFLDCFNFEPFVCLVTFTALCACQAEKELQPWIAKDNDLGQKMWRINQRIVKLIVELMRNHETPESLVILASALDLLLRATDGMLVDEEACTLPQLELLEATVRAVQPVLGWEKSGLTVVNGLSNLLKEIIHGSTNPNNNVPMDIELAVH